MLNAHKPMIFSNIKKSRKKVNVNFGYLGRIAFPQLDPPPRPNLPDQV
jgi:hypothetical protein